ncbi:DUF6069 family protein [Frankia sp. AiPa1]|uniref:DUF6069 family protein n=1 Tax=Frankia sp. AiPa1 TaxID=573492 RepID=UPI00202AC285|nr:DUF6069 family protein [Frankia sp. AiPa1]MCL9759374.1 DUF6069 family protein [Frankia sp. AiPa1]
MREHRLSTPAAPHSPAAVASSPGAVPVDPEPTFTAVPASVPASGSGSVAGRRARVVLVAAGLGVAGWVFAGPVAGVSLRVRAGGPGPVAPPGATGGHGDRIAVTHAVGFSEVVVAAVLAGLAATALLVVLERRIRRARRWWAGIAGATLAGSFTGPLAAHSVAAGVSLAALHLLVGATLLVGLARTTCPPSSCAPIPRAARDAEPAAGATGTPTAPGRP